jgi:hypothetical protein
MVAQLDKLHTARDTTPFPDVCCCLSPRETDFFFRN